MKPQHELGFEVYPQDLRGFCTWEVAVKAVKELGDGWRLPTKDELNQMYLKKETIGGFGAYYYWSSSEYYAYNAWYQNFSSGFQGSDDKHNYDRVRPVRDIPLTRDHDETVEARLRIDPEYAVALYHEQRKQIEELVEGLDISVKTTELHSTTCETARVKYTAAVQRIEELEDRLEEYTSAYKTIMQERCGADERHCTCVPPLKLRVRELENKVVRLERQLSPQIATNKGEVNINRGEAIGWTDPRTMTCEQLANGG